MTHREQLRTQFSTLLSLWWKCVERDLYSADHRRMIEEELTGVATDLGTDFYRTPPEEGHMMFLPLKGKRVPRSTILRTPEYLASLNAQFRTQLTAREIDATDYSWDFFDGVREFEYASIPHPITPLSLTSDHDVARALQPVLAPEEQHRPELRQVQFNARLQRAVGINTMVIVALPWAVEGKHTHYLYPSRKIPDSRLVFPEWEPVVPLQAGVESVQVPIQRLLNRLPGILNLTRVFNWHLGTSPTWYSLRGAVEIGSDLTVAFDSVQLSQALTVLARAGTTRVVLRATAPLKPVLIVDADDPRRFACLFAQRREELVGRLFSLATATTDPPEFTGLTHFSARS